MLKTITLLVSVTVVSAARYEPNWTSLDSRPLPVWYDKSKIGIFLHWGVFSVPSYKTAWFWDNWKNKQNKAIVSFMERNYKPNFTYADFAPDFTAELFDPNDWADLFHASGARFTDYFHSFLYDSVPDNSLLNDNVPNWKKTFQRIK